MKTLLQILRLC